MARSSVLLGPTGQPIRTGQRKPLNLRTIEAELKAALAENPEPTKIGDGPAGFALTKTADRQPFRWDANQFYERLGLEAGCPRVEIVRAYQESPRETSEQHLHYATAAKALLKKTKRRMYDALPLGAFYGDDPALAEAINDLDDDERLAPLEAPGWAYYAEGDITEEDVAGYDWASVRTILTDALASWAAEQDEVPYVGLGLTTMETRWVPVGYLPILLIGVDTEVTEAYASQIAARLRIP